MDEKVVAPEQVSTPIVQQQPQRQLTKEEFEKVRNEFICGFFQVKDPSAVPRATLQSAVFHLAQQAQNTQQIMGQLACSLYCVDPNDPLVKDQPAKTLQLFEQERQRRLATRKRIILPGMKLFGLGGR
jgi:hypothetical protein